MEEDTLMSRADISGGNGRHKPVGAPRTPTSCYLRMQFINHSASDGHAVRRAAGGAAVVPSGCSSVWSCPPLHARGLVWPPLPGSLCAQSMAEKGAAEIPELAGNRGH